MVVILSELYDSISYLSTYVLRQSKAGLTLTYTIGHSLGEILIKQALVNAHSNTRYKPTKEATSGLVFFGTPHAGGKDALVLMGRIAARVATKVLHNPSKDVMEALGKGSLFSDTLQEGWRHQLNLYKIVTFYEGIGDVSSVQNKAETS